MRVSANLSLCETCHAKRRGVGCLREQQSAPQGTAAIVIKSLPQGQLCSLSDMCPSIQCSAGESGQLAGHGVANPLCSNSTHLPHCLARDPTPRGHQGPCKPWLQLSLPVKGQPVIPGWSPSKAISRRLGVAPDGNKWSLPTQLTQLSQ